MDHTSGSETRRRPGLTRASRLIAIFLLVLVPLKLFFEWPISIIGSVVLTIVLFLMPVLVTADAWTPKVQRQLSELPSDSYERRMQLRDRERELRTIARTAGTTSNKGRAASDGTPSELINKGHGCLLAFLIGVLIVFAIVGVLFIRWSMWVSGCGPGGCW
jgi:energy-coupling factor transporter transmembrane protein EcfT